MTDSSLYRQVRRKAGAVLRRLGLRPAPAPKPAGAKPAAAPKPAVVTPAAPAKPAPRHPLPPKGLRMGGAHFMDDEAFIATAARDVRRLEDLAGLTTSSRLLDWGCGAGRLAIGVREVFGRVEDYHGVDVQKHLIEWADKRLTAPGFRFTWVDLANARYNPDGSPERTIGAEPASVDVFYAYSVYSHLMADDTEAYLGLMSAALASGGRAFITLFVEDGVPDCEENPEGYGPLEWVGPLHCVRYDRAYFERLVAAAGLDVVLHEHGQETDGQSLYILGKP
jgi:SAM-dependent methyltransferase